ncbi:uncharacterized protein TM35_000034160 [Trypanosoma theileri]|uniref:Uncharacterized protein n=1 Tax=Trypanosoma theileri TaxID=67003 RepID=A0A1X0P7Q7_9TRYP|nr:uncharacterized protein TM35_000034160 [Trypanosoma theileri]ORC92663.1 hypothetical protein TM35_000034160 [Trypanosoma theileri]
MRTRRYKRKEETPPPSAKQQQQDKEEKEGEEENQEQHIHEQQEFLAYAQHQLAVQCCRAHARLTACTGPAFLSLARDECSAHENAYRSVRSAIAASCALGHRSCHALWGPRGCGEHRILRLVAQECMQREQTLVLYLDGDTLNSDEDALRCTAQQLLQFLKSPQSAKLRAADWSLRTGTFDFGNLFGFHKLLQSEEEEKGGDASSGAGSDNDELIGRHKSANGQLKRTRTENQESSKKETTKRGRDSTVISSRPSAATTTTTTTATGSENEDECSDDEDMDPLLVTSTTAYAGGGASSALPALQRSLLLMKSYGTNLVVCIRRVERFGIWCDQLLYVLSGLMHESDGRGGGMSLVMTSSTPDIRQLEKRLSSRLTCETRCIPLLPWSATRVARACLVEIKERLQHNIEKMTVKTKRKTNQKKGREENSLNDENNYINKPFTGWCFDVISASKEQLQHQNLDHQQQVHEGKVELQNGLNDNLVGGDSTQLLQESMLEIVNVVINELDSVDPAAAFTADSEGRQKSTDDNLFAWRIARISGQLQSIGATAGRVMAAVASAFAEVSSGRLILLDKTSHESVFSWLKLRLVREGRYNFFSRSLSTAPDAVRAQWVTEISRNPSRKRNIQSITVFPSSCEHHLLFGDMFSDCRLVELGYCTREMILILAYVYLRHEGGVSRTVVDLLEDVASSMGTAAAAALDRSAFRSAVAALHRWRILRVAGRDGTGLVSLRGTPARLREFLQTVLNRSDYCSSILGLEARDVARLRSLI